MYKLKACMKRWRGYQLEVKGKNKNQKMLLDLNDNIMLTNIAADINGMILDRDNLQ